MSLISPETMSLNSKERNEILLWRLKMEERPSANAAAANRQRVNFGLPPIRKEEDEFLPLLNLEITLHIRFHLTGPWLPRLPYFLSRPQPFQFEPRYLGCYARFVPFPIAHSSADS